MMIPDYALVIDFHIAINSLFESLLKFSLGIEAARCRPNV